jgi:hypothetical protein
LWRFWKLQSNGVAGGSVQVRRIDRLVVEVLVVDILVAFMEGFLVITIIEVNGGAGGGGSSFGVNTSGGAGEMVRQD